MLIVIIAKWSSSSSTTVSPSYHHRYHWILTTRTWNGFNLPSTKISSKIKHRSSFGPTTRNLCTSIILVSPFLRITNKKCFFEPSLINCRHRSLLTFFSSPDKGQRSCYPVYDYVNYMYCLRIIRNLVVVWSCMIMMMVI